ncbi:MAG: 30S ribosomal protein S24e [Cuniculiplasma sp.]
MNIKIEESKENVLLKRKEIRYTVEFEKNHTPSREVIKELIARNTNSNKELIIVDRNEQLTGLHVIRGYSKIYSTKEDAMLYEPDYELFRNGLKVKEEK